ncbi:hypothetical protein MUK42_01838 [Musa troglodytarum]|uniref:Uncharacterized protein n=1 Tax=Musa troglodytarum TaxID=320322 RepID=A0A9E7FDL9_9LILI|nr:hypothetical protein MUK42_01838 [Musa troglodytarum]
MHACMPAYASSLSGDVDHGSTGGLLVLDDHSAGRVHAAGVAPVPVLVPVRRPALPAPPSTARHSRPLRVLPVRQLPRRRRPGLALVQAHCLHQLVEEPRLLQPWRAHRFLYRRLHLHGRLHHRLHPGHPLVPSQHRHRRPLLEDEVALGGLSAVLHLHLALHLGLVPHLGGEIAPRRAHPPGEPLEPLRSDLRLAVHVPPLRVAVHLDGRREILEGAGLHRVRPVVEVVGWHVEGADGRHRGPEIGVDGAGVDDREGHAPAHVPPVDGRIDLAERAVGPWSRQLGCRWLAKRISVPCVLVAVIRHKDLKDGPVGVSGDDNGGGLDAGLAVDTMPKPGAVVPIGLGDGEDDVGGLVVEGSDGGVRHVGHRRRLAVVERSADGDGVLEHHGHDPATVCQAAEKGGVAGDVLVDAPEGARGHGDGSDGSEDLDAVDPDGTDAGLLGAGDGEGQSEDHARPREGAVRGVGVVGGDRRRADGVSEVLSEDDDRAVRGVAREGGGEGGVQVFQ